MKKLLAALVVTLGTAALAQTAPQPAAPSGVSSQALQEQQRLEGRQISTGVDAADVGPRIDQATKNAQNTISGKTKSAKAKAKQDANKANQDVKKTGQDVNKAVDDTANDVQMPSSPPDATSSDVLAFDDSKVQDAKDKAGDVKNDVKDKAHDAKNAAKDKAHDAKNAAKDKTHDAKNAAKDKAHDAKNAAKDATH